MEQNYSNEELENIVENGRGVSFGSASVVLMAQDLLTERRQPKVWDGAPDNAIIAKVHFYKADKVYARPDGTPEVYTRELPKSPEREIAEEIFTVAMAFNTNLQNKEELIEDIVKRLKRSKGA